MRYLILSLLLIFLIAAFPISDALAQDPESSLKSVILPSPPEGKQYKFVDMFDGVDEYVIVGIENVPMPSWIELRFAELNMTTILALLAGISPVYIAWRKGLSSNPKKKSKK